MDTLLKTALVGTGKYAEIKLDDGHDVGALIKSMLITDQEEQLLLAAGGYTIYQQAGLVPMDVAVLEPAPPSLKVLRSHRLIHLLDQSIQDQKTDLLQEFLKAMQQHRVELPYEVLPQALNITETVLREQLLPVLGERGRWLSQWNPRWQWVAQGIHAITNLDRTALRRAWDVGKLAQRALAISIIRQADAAEGRRWLEETLPQEKADARATLVEHLQVGLSSEDEALLESLLDDRSEQVKQIAASLLKQLPGSAFGLRMQTRAEGMLRKEGTGLKTCPPDELPTDWSRDGVPSKVPTGRGKKAYWLEMIFSAVPLTLWTAHFALSPQKLLVAIQKDEFADDVIQGWTRATELDPKDSAARLAWAYALWDHWLLRWQQDKKKSQQTLSRMITVLKLLPSGTAEQNVLPFLVIGRLDLDALILMLDVLPRPWSVAFAQQYLKLARQILKNEVVDQAHEWGKTLEIAGSAIPETAFNAALAAWDVERKAKSWTATALTQQVERFVEVVRLRQLFLEEIRSEVK
ncbi:MAG TPA: DUF5691 domain-containing protein [Gemmatales bacterium]|nr:DUF5691 domain-containing protein [Gemmatales bacterium]